MHVTTGTSRLELHECSTMSITNCKSKALLLH